MATHCWIHRHRPHDLWILLCRGGHPRLKNGETKVKWNFWSVYVTGLIIAAIILTALISADIAINGK
jgi:hypothetical protein